MVADRRLEQRDGLRRGDTSEFGRGDQRLGRQLQGDAPVARGFSPFLFGHRIPEILPRHELAGNPRPRRQPSWPRVGCAAAGDAVVGRHRVGDVRDRRAWHVAGDAILARPPRPPLGDRQGAAPPLVALQASAAIVLGLGGRRRQAVRVVARNAAEFPPAGTEAPARLHLLDLADQFQSDPGPTPR